MDRIETLIGREPTLPNMQMLQAPILNNSVLVTGAGGSIGSELCRQIIKLQPRILILVERTEFFLYSIYSQLRNINSNINIVPLLADINDRDRIEEIFSRWNIDIVFHTAACKHVPIVESNPLEGIENNVFGTINCAQIAVNHGVKQFVFISTDKAVNPTSVMGATKRLCEIILQSMNKHNKTKFTIVRFGNVLGSSGSVVPLFEKQIKEGGPVTVTDLETDRYFMSILEASQLLIQAAALSRGGEIFLLDMGQPIKIIDLAKRMIKLMKGDHKHIEIKITGMRPGERIHEQLCNC